MINSSSSNHKGFLPEAGAIKFFLGSSVRRKSSKLKEKKKLRKNLILSTNKKLIVNLTNQILPEQLTSILSRGLKFIPTPSQTKLQTILDSFNSFRRSMYTKFYY